MIFGRLQSLDIDKQMGNASVSGQRREDVESTCVPVVNNKKVLLLGCGDTGNKNSIF